MTPSLWRLLTVLAVLVPVGLTAQIPDTLVVDTAIVDRVAPIGMPPPDTGLPASPAGAMIRSMVLPGWGQAKFEGYFRGGVYFTGWVGNWYMIFRNAYRLENVENRYDIRREQVAEQLIANASDPDSMAAQLDSFPTLLDGVIREDSLGNELRKLVRAREQQQEDWIAWSLFWVLASGIDAYVTAHLADFPAEIELRSNRDRSVSVELTVPWAPGPPLARPARPAERPPFLRTPGRLEP